MMTAQHSAMDAKTMPPDYKHADSARSSPERGHMRSVSGSAPRTSTKNVKEEDDSGGQDEDEEEDDEEEQKPAAVKAEPKAAAQQPAAADEDTEPKVTKKSRRELPPHTVAILKGWMLSPEHVKHPYPTDEVSIGLGQADGVGGWDEYLNTVMADRISKCC